MSDLSSRVSKLSSEIKEDLANLQKSTLQVQEQLKSALETHNFALTNLQHTERGVALAMGAYLDTACRDCIKFWMAEDAAVQKDIFGERGLLGSLADKIQFMYVVGVYSKHIYTILMSVARIRNRFAHDFDVDSFSHPRVLGLVDHLTLELVQIKIAGREKPMSMLQILEETNQSIDFKTVRPEYKYVATVNALAEMLKYYAKHIAEQKTLNPRDPAFGAESSSPEKSS